MKIAVYGNSFKDEFIPHISIFFDKLYENHSEVIVYKPYYDFIRAKLKKEFLELETYSLPEEVSNDTNLFVSIGGDGTFLESVRYVRNKGIPILGINSGRLGFLANISKEEISHAMEAIFAGDYQVEERSLINFIPEGDMSIDFSYALNEVTIQKSNSSMLTIFTYINGEFLNAYWADGLIISTPTGSTAYSMSVGGPIIIPGTNSFIISPIAPHNLSVRPLVFSGDAEIGLKVEARSNKFLATVDNRSMIMDVSQKILLKKAEFGIGIIKLSSNSFFNTLRTKLMWGADKRN